MYRSRIFSVCIAAAALAVVAYAEVSTAIDYAWRFARKCTYDFGRWLMAKIPKAPQDWLARGWHRLHGALGIAQLRHQATLRRPLLSSRWRMCPST